MEPERYQNGLTRAENSRFGFKIIKFCHGRIDDKDFYAFMAIDPKNIGYFENHYKAGAYSDFSFYGQEILRGWGEAPPEDIVEYLKFKYSIEFGVDPAYILHLTQMTLQNNQNGYTDLQSPFLSPNLQERSNDILAKYPQKYPKEYPEKPAEALSS